MEHDDLDVPSEILNDVTSGRSHVPSYLGRIGIRISTFTKILAKGVVMILKDGDVPSVFPDHVFSLYQRYLSACNVAYTSNDYTDDLEKMFRALLVNKKLSQKREKGKKRKKEMRKMKAKEVLEKSVTAWDLLMSSTLDENLELHSDEEQQEVEDSKKASTSRSHIEPQLVEVVNTTIPKEILNHAMSCYLALDVLVALLFISLVTIGCKWILLSDIVRWVREGRSQISVFQLSALRTGKLEEAMTAKSWWTNMNIPLYEFYRTVLFVWQLCRLPPTPVKVDFQQIVAQLLYHLNLPKVFMERVLLLMEKAPPCTELDEKNLRRQGSLEHSRFVNGFFVNERKKFSASRMLNVFGRQKHSVNNFNTDIFFSIETKAYAYILMALKLCFGLDGVREFNDNDNTDSTINVTFNVMQWLFQLKMRMMFWEGYDPADILQTHKPVQPLYYEKNFIHGQFSHLERSKRFTGDNIKYHLRYSSREYGFTHCIPSSMRIDSSASIPNPFPEYTCGIHTYGNDDDALYAPLRYQETVLSKFLSLPRTAEEKQEIRMSTDEYAIRTFKADFNNYILITESSFPTNRRTFPKEGGICFSDVNRARNWSSYFPCAERYVRYPRPIFTSGGILRMKEAEVDSSSHGASMKHSTASSLQMLFASRKSAIDAWESAKSSMSSTFTMLVHFFSKIIGESEHVLYGAFMMLEFQIVDHKRFNELKKAMVDGKSYPLRTTRAYVCKENERSYGTFDVSAANNISDASEIDVVRLEVSKECGNSSDNPKNIDFDTMDSEYSSYSDSDSDFATTDSSSDNTTKISKKRSSNSSSKRTGADRRTSLHQRKINKTQRHCRAYEFDVIWMLVTMRYW